MCTSLPRAYSCSFGSLIELISLLWLSQTQSSVHVNRGPPTPCGATNQRKFGLKVGGRELKYKTNKDYCDYCELCKATFVERKNKYVELDINIIGLHLH